MKDSKLNVAEPTAMNDILFQAQLLTRRMNTHNYVNVYNDWKVGVILHIV
jgi:hypothetical protein